MMSEFVTMKCGTKATQMLAESHRIHCPYCKIIELKEQLAEVDLHIDYLAELIAMEGGCLGIEAELSAADDERAKILKKMKKVNVQEGTDDKEGKGNEET